MKAAMNGGLNLSVLDGWWDEASARPASSSIPPRSPGLSESGTSDRLRIAFSTGLPPRARPSQVLPLGPTGFGSSPYGVLSAFAGNPLLLSPERLVEDGLVS